MTLEDLLDERAIQHQLIALASAMDRRAWDELDTIMAEDVTGDLGDGTAISSRRQFVGMFRKFLGNCGPTQHLLGNFRIEVGGNQASSRCYVRDLHQGSGDRSGLFLSTPGEYRDRWLRTAQGWRMIHRTKINIMMVGSLDALGLDT